MNIEPGWEIQLKSTCERTLQCAAKLIGRETRAAKKITDRRKRLQERIDSLLLHIARTFDAQRHFVRRGEPDPKPMLTKNEKLLIADALNGANILIDCDPNWLGLMAGPEGAIQDAAVIGHDEQGRVLLTGSEICSGLEHEIYDAIRLNRLDEKWKVDGAALLEKIRALAVAERIVLFRVVLEVWRRNDEHFERDLESLAI